MTLKYEDLVKFVNELVIDGFEYEIPDMVLIQRIGMRFGISDYTTSNIKKQLHKFGFMSPNGNVWKIDIK